MNAKPFVGEAFWGRGGCNWGSPRYNYVTSNYFQNLKENMEEDYKNAMVCKNVKKNYIYIFCICKDSITLKT